MSVPGSGLTLPASVTLALWLPAVDASSPATARAALAATALASGLEPPVEQTLVGADDPAALVGLLCDLAPVGQVGAVLPVPGDPMGLPPGVEAPAEEATVVQLGGADGPARTLVLAPVAVHYGSALEPGRMLQWQATAVAPMALAADGISFARRELHRATTDAVDVLTELDVARTSPDLADRLNDLMLSPLEASLLPAGLDQRVVAVLESAARLSALVELALEDEGAALTSGQILARRTALAPVHAAARRALCAASLRGGN